MQRKLTKKQEQVLRLCHHEFEGRTQHEAAEIMGCAPQSISRILRQVKKVLPEFFPILTQWQWRVNVLLESGCNRQEVAERFGRDLKSIDNVIQQLHKKGFDRIPLRKPIHYEPFMDAEIKEKF